MKTFDSSRWKEKVVRPEEVLSQIKPGMSIFLGTGVAEPRTLIKHLMASALPNLKDLDLIQLLSFGDAIPLDERYALKYRLRTFFSGWVASEAITSGRIDLIPYRFSRIPDFFRSGMVRLDAAFVKVTPPDERGFCSLGPAVDVARNAMEQARFVVGEMSDSHPFALGDTFVPVDSLHYIVRSEDPPFYFPRWQTDEAFDRLASNVSSIIEDGSCLCFLFGALFEALARPLSRKRDLGIQSLLFTDPLMDLIRSGAVTNRRKRLFRGKTLVSYAQGTKELMDWLHGNPLVEFQGIDVVTDPRSVGLNSRFMAIIPARKVDLTGNIALHAGKGNVSAGPGEVQEMIAGAIHSPGGRTIMALPSRNLEGKSNILSSVDPYPNQFTYRESIDFIVTDYGIASLRGRTVRERALALIDIAHPDDRGLLVEEARKANILYRDQIYFAESGRLYPEDVSVVHTFRDDLTIRFRPIRPSDEDEMRRLFYRFSDKAVYYRYFSPIKTMPHMTMQAYVNTDYDKTLSIVGTMSESGMERIVAEGRYVRLEGSAFADTAFVVDEKYQGSGIASFLFRLLIDQARKRNIRGFRADVLTDNKAMMKVFEKAPFPLQAVVNAGVYELTIPFPENGDFRGPDSPPP